jgi:Flp pilus assembly pilin Flp
MHDSWVALRSISLLNLWRDEEGQDLIEYSLLMAFVTIAVVGLFAGAGGNIKNVWTASNNQLAQAKSAAS